MVCTGLLGLHSIYLSQPGHLIQFYYDAQEKKLCGKTSRKMTFKAIIGTPTGHITNVLWPVTKNCLALYRLLRAQTDSMHRKSKEMTRLELSWDSTHTLLTYVIWISVSTSQQILDYEILFATVNPKNVQKSYKYFSYS